jgi:hypothetical protein
MLHGYVQSLSPASKSLGRCMHIRTLLWAAWFSPELGARRCACTKSMTCHLQASTAAPSLSLSLTFCRQEKMQHMLTTETVCLGSTAEPYMGLMGHSGTAISMCNRPSAWAQPYMGHQSMGHSDTLTACYSVSMCNILPPCCMSPYGSLHFNWTKQSRRRCILLCCQLRLMGSHTAHSLGVGCAWPRIKAYAFKCCNTNSTSSSKPSYIHQRHQAQLARVGAKTECEAPSNAEVQPLGRQDAMQKGVADAAAS